MTTPATPQSDFPEPVLTGPYSQDSPGWRLAFLLVTAAVDGGWVRFARVMVLVMILAVAVGLLVHLLGPLAATGLSLGTAGATALTRCLQTERPISSARNRNASTARR